jgi:hypothetical protein
MWVVFEGNGGAGGPFRVLFGDTLFGSAADVNVLAFANLADEDGWYAVVTCNESV